MLSALQPVIPAKTGIQGIEQFLKILSQKLDAGFRRHDDS